VRFYVVDGEKKENEYEKASIDEIMEFEEMPTKTYLEIVSEMNIRFENNDKKIKEVDLEIERINNIIKKAIELGGDENVLSKAKKLLYDMEWEKKKLEMKYRFFYHRLLALDLIEPENK
jgi:pectate lyase